MSTKKPTKQPAPRAKPRRERPRAESGAPVRDDLSAIVDLIADAKERGAFDPKNRLRAVAKPMVTNTPGAPFARISRAWLGFGELPSDPELNGAIPMARHKATGEDITIGSPVELLVLACKSNVLRCRLLGTAREITLRTAVRDEVPGVIVTVMPTKQWTHARHAYLAGKVLSMRTDVEALGLVPLALQDQGEWEPSEQYWGDEDEPIEAWAKPIIARGKRPMFEFEQVLPGDNQGARFNLAAVEAGKTWEEMEGDE